MDLKNVIRQTVALVNISIFLNACGELSANVINTPTPIPPTITKVLENPIATPVSISPLVTATSTLELDQEDWLSMQNPVLGLDWSMDDRILAMSSNSGVYIFDMQSQLMIRLLEVDELIFPLVMDIQGNRMFAGNRVWDIASGQLLFQLPVVNVLAATFSHDGNTLVLNDGNNITLWDTLTGKLQKPSVYKFEVPQVIWEGSMVYSAEGNLLYFVDNHKVIQVDLASGQSTQLFTLPESSCCSVFSRDAKYIIVNLPNHGMGSKQLWDVGEAKIIKDTGNCSGDVSFSVISSNSKYFVVGCLPNLQLWDIPTQQISHEFPPATLLSTQPNSALPVSPEWRSAVFSPNNTKIAIGNNFGEVFIWDLNNYQLIKSITIPLPDKQ